MESNKILYSKGKNDECYTPWYGVKPILKYIPNLSKHPKIWCPFDKDDSNFVKILKDNGFDVINTHIDDGYDFYNYQPLQWDIIISNPPFTNKKKIFERALSFGKPFALLMTLIWLNDSGPKKVFKDSDLQLLMFDKRIEFNNNKKITFSSGYYCYDFLPKQIIMEDLII